METARAELGQSEEFATVGKSCRGACLDTLFFLLGASVVWEAGRSLLQEDYKAAALWAAFGIVLFVIPWLLLRFYVRRVSIAFRRDGVVVRTGFFARRKTLVPWSQVEGVEPLSRDSTQGLGIRLSAGSSLRQSTLFSLLGSQEELRCILAAMEKYSGREFKL